MSFEKELETLLNKYSKETDNDTPDFILAKYLNRCLDNFSEAIIATSKWMGIDKSENITSINDPTENNVVKMYPRFDDETDNDDLLA